MISTQHNPKDILNSDIFINIDKNASRKIYRYEANRTCSYVPNVCLNQKHAQSFKPSVHELWLNSNVTQEFVNDSLRYDIEYHFEKRLLILFQQAIFLYKTGIQCWDASKAFSQEGGSLGSPSGTDKRQYAAAHDSTLPSLIVGWGETRVLTIGDDTSFNRMCNATTLLPVCVNQVDSKIDEGNFQGYPNLRSAATQLLNRVSNGDLTPKDCLQLFVDKAFFCMKQINYSPGSRNKCVLEAYLRVAQDYDKLLRTGEKLKNLELLCCLPKGSSLASTNLYMTAQKLMHRLFSYELGGARTMVPHSLQHPVSLLLPIITTSMRGFLEEGMIVETRKTFDYAKICFNDSGIRELVLCYLTQRSATILKKDLNTLVSSPNPTQKEKNVRMGIFEVYRRTMLFIREDQGIQRVNHGKMIVLLVLQEISRCPDYESAF